MGKETESYLHKQLVKLGGMIGDGLHLEPGGKWIEKEYSRVLRELGYAPPRSNNSESINRGMAKALENALCENCGGKLKQTRSGSLRAKCVTCGVKYQFKRG